MTYSGRGAYADYDGVDMLRRLTPGWGGELSWELGRVLVGALAATAMTDAAARLLAVLGWPWGSTLRKIGRRSKTRRERAMQAGFALVIPLAAASLPSLLLGYLLFDNVPDDWGWWLPMTFPVLVIIAFVSIAGWTGSPHLRLAFLKKTPANQRPGVKQLMTGNFVAGIFIASFGAGLWTMDLTERAFRVRVFSNKEAIRMRLIVCSIGADQKLTVTGLVANVGTRLAAMDAHAQAILEGQHPVRVKLELNPVPTDGPMLVLKPSEGKAFRLINDPAREPYPLPPESFEGKDLCMLTWHALGPDADITRWGDTEDHRATKK
jgi:hypothetical protein